METEATVATIALLARVAAHKRTHIHFLVDCWALTKPDVTANLSISSALSYLARFIADRRWCRSAQPGYRTPVRSSDVPVHAAAIFGRGLSPRGMTSPYLVVGGAQQSEHPRGEVA